MFYGLVSGEITYPGYTFLHDLSDIESLNQRALKGELEVTAVSVHAFAHLKGRYLIMNSGASMGGEDYGPKLVVKKGGTLSSKRKLRIAIPGLYTSAALALKIYLKEHAIEAELTPIDFDKVQDVVLSGEFDAGVIIHEGQLTHEREGLTSLVDLGAWWWEETKLPLPLGVNVVRKDIGSDAIKASSDVLKRSIIFSLAHRKESLAYALKFGRGIDETQANTFVGMYVNERTVDLGEEGRTSIRLFLDRGIKHGLIPDGVKIEFVQE